MNCSFNVFTVIGNVMSVLLRARRHRIYTTVRAQKQYQICNPRLPANFGNFPATRPRLFEKNPATLTGAWMLIHGS